MYRFDYTIIYSAGRASLRRKSVCNLDVQNIKGKRKPNAATKISTPVNIAHSCHVSPLTMRFTVLNPEKVAPTVARKTKATIKIEGSIICTASFYTVQRYSSTNCSYAAERFMSASLTYLTGIKSPTFQNQLLYIIYKNQLAKIYFISISSSDKLILSNYISNVNTKDNYFLYCAFNMQCLLTHLYFLRNLCSTSGTSRPTNRISSQAAFFSIYKIFEKSRRHMHNGL